MAKNRLNREVFIKQYALTGNGKESALAAGSTETSAAVAASRLLKDDNVLTRVREERQKLADQLCVNTDSLLLKLQDVYEKCTAAKPVMEWDYEEHKMVETGEYVFDSKGALKAIELMGDFTGALKKTVDVNTNPGTGKLDAILKQLEGSENG